MLHRTSDFPVCLIFSGLIFDRSRGSNIVCRQTAREPTVPASIKLAHQPFVLSTALRFAPRVCLKPRRRSHHLYVTCFYCVHVRAQVHIASRYVSSGNPLECDVKLLCFSRYRGTITERLQTSCLRYPCIATTSRSYVECNQYMPHSDKS